MLVSTHERIRFQIDFLIIFFFFNWFQRNRLNKINNAVLVNCGWKCFVFSYCCYNFYFAHAAYHLSRVKKTQQRNERRTTFLLFSVSCARGVFMLLKCAIYQNTWNWWDCGVCYFGIWSYVRNEIMFFRYGERKCFCSVPFVLSVICYCYVLNPCCF